MKVSALLGVAIVGFATARAQKLQVETSASSNETETQQIQELLASASGDASESGELGLGSLVDSTSGSGDASTSTSASGSWGDVFVGDIGSDSASEESAESGSSSEESATSSAASLATSGSSGSSSLVDSASGSQSANAPTSASGSSDDVLRGDSDSTSASEASEDTGSSLEASLASSSTSASSGEVSSGSGEVDSSLPGSTSGALDSSAATSSTESSGALSDASSSEESAASEESGSASTTATASASGGSVSSGSGKVGLGSLLDSTSASESASASTSVVSSSASASSTTPSFSASATGDASGSLSSGSSDSTSESQGASAATSASGSGSGSESNAAVGKSAASDDSGSTSEVQVASLSASASASAAASSSGDGSGLVASGSDDGSLLSSVSGSQDATSASGSSGGVAVGDPESSSGSTLEPIGSSSGAPPTATEAPTPAPTEAPTQAPVPTTPPISMEDAVQLSESFGGPHGNDFSDEAAATSGQTVASVTVRAGERVDGVALELTAPVATILNHGGGGGSPNTLTLGPGEYITSMEAHSGEKKGHTRIFYLRFGTSAGNWVEGGSMTDSKSTVTAPEGFQLGGFFGRDGDEIDLLGAIWTSIAVVTPAPGAQTPAPTPWAEKVIGHDAVVPFKQPEPVTISEKAAVKFKPQLHITNGCHPYPAVNAIGETSGGLKTTGAPSGDCKGSGWGSQVYGRSSWYNGVWAIMYSWYFPKDSPSTGLGHRHDWEHVIVWIDNPEIAEPKILAVTPSAHSGYSSQVPPEASDVDGTSVKVKYLSKWPINHALESTGEGGDYQDLIMWSQMTDAARQALGMTNFDKANVPMKDGSFEGKLGKAWPFG